MSAVVKGQNVRPYIYISMVGIAALAFGIGLLLGSFGGVFDLYDQVEPLINSGELTEDQGRVIAAVPSSTKGVMLFSALLALAGLVATVWAGSRAVKHSRT